MHLRITNKLIIYPELYYEYKEIRMWLEDHYIIDNPEYIKRVKLNKWLGGVPKKIYLFERYSDYFCIGYGAMDEVLKHLKEVYKDTLTIDYRLNNIPADWSNFKAYSKEYQKRAIAEMVKHKCGILKAPCSSGKTYMGHCIAASLGRKTLWLTHKKDLLDQAYETGKKFFGGDDSRIAKTVNGKLKIGETITYATVQTLSKMISMKNTELLTAWDCIITDECHHLCTKGMADMMSKIVNGIKATYKFGLSATPETHDGYFRTILTNTGNIVYEIQKEELEEIGAVMPVSIIRVNSSWDYPDEAFKSDGTLDWYCAVDWLIKDQKRNKLIANIASKGESTLILAKQVEHLIRIANELPDEVMGKVCVVTTQDLRKKVKEGVHYALSMNNREIALKKMRSGEFTIMLSTYSLAQEGLDIPILKNVIMAFPAVDDNIITQVLGRVARTHNEKEEAICYDIVDKPGYFRKKFSARKRLYKKLNYKIMDY